MATNPYTSQSASGYNASPPPDDGSTTAENEITWAVIKTKLADVIKTLAENINTAVLAAFAKTINTDASEANAIAGSLAFTDSTLTIASGSVTAVRSAHVIAAETGTSDDLDTVAVASVSDGCLLFLRGDTGDRITLKNGTGNLTLGRDIALSTTGWVTLRRNGANWQLADVSSREDYALYQDDPASTSGSSGYASGGWRTATLRTETYDTGSIGALASNQVTLQPGSYWYFGRVALHNTAAGGYHRARLYNATDTAVIHQGVQDHANTGTGVVLAVMGVFTITAAKAVELQVYPTQTITGGGEMSMGTNEVYTSLFLRRFAT